MWEVCSFLWKLLKLVARGHRCSLDSSRHNYSSSPQFFFSVSSNNNHKVSEAAIEIVYTLLRISLQIHTEKVYSRDVMGVVSVCWLPGGEKKNWTTMAVANQKDIHAYKL